MADITRVTDIKSVYWSSEIFQHGDIVENLEDIHQSIYLILNTRKRTCPHRPGFGSNLRDYIGYPINDAIPYVIRETFDALEDNEPRINLLNVDVSIDQHVINLTITWTIKESEVKNITEVKVNGRT